MLVLCKYLLNFLRLWPLAESRSDYMVSISRYTMIFSLEITLWIGSFLYVLSHLDDIDEATDPGFTCFAFLTTIFIYVWLISKKRLIRTVMETLESSANESNTSILQILWLIYQQYSLFSFNISKIFCIFYFKSRNKRNQ